MPDARQRAFFDRAVVRLVICLGVGIGVGIAAATAWAGVLGAVLGWVVAAFSFVGWTLLQTWPMSPDETSEHATSEDAGRVVADLLLVVAAVASLVGVGFLLFAGQQANQAAEAVLGVASVVASWSLVHTLFALRYARLFYIDDDDGGIDFNNDDHGQPGYSDFLYVAFTIGMTYQVSDTVFTRPDFRQVALRQALLAYLFGSVILACTINLVVQLASSGS